MMRLEDNVAYFEGNLTLDQAVPVLKEGEQLLAKGVEVFDLAGLVHVDSAALSLLMNWHREASSLGRTLEFKHAPESLRCLAKLYGVAELINLS